MGTILAGLLIGHHPGHLVVKGSDIRRSNVDVLAECAQFKSTRLKFSKAFSLGIPRRTISFIRSIMISNFFA